MAEGSPSNDMDVEPLSESEPEEVQEDPHDLQRYTSKQCIYFNQALKEINRGQKQSCWMWYMIPTPPWIVNGEERGSYTNQRYSIRSDEQALVFLKFEAEGQNLRNNYLRIMEAILEQLESGRDPVRLIGMVDYPKLISSVKYFNKICKDGVDDEIFKVTSEILPLIPAKSKKKKQQGSIFNWFNRAKSTSSAEKTSNEDKSPFKVGMEVKLKDLMRNEKSYNGKVGKIEKRLPLSNCYKVRVGSSLQSVTLTVKASNMSIPKPQISRPKTVPIPIRPTSPQKAEELTKAISTNLRDGDLVRVHMVGRSIHGKQGVIHGEYDEEKKRYSVLLEGERFKRSIQPDCLRLIKLAQTITPTAPDSKQQELEKPTKSFKKGDQVQFESKLQENLHGKEGEICGTYDPVKGRYPVRFDHTEVVEYVLPKFLSLVQTSRTKTKDADSMEVENNRR